MVSVINPPQIYPGTRADLSKKHWRPLDGDKDILLLRNQPRHIIEGTGAGGMLLGEGEVELRQKYGEPAYRDHANPELLTYTEERFTASYLLKNGRITEVRLEVEKHKSPSLAWFTALGLHENDLAGLTATEAARKLSRFYGTQRLRLVGDRVEVLSRGIAFQFRGKLVIRIDVLKPIDYGDE